MSIPNVFVAKSIPKGADDPHGIIYYIRQKVGNDEILKYVKPSANVSTNAGNVQTIVKWDSYWQSQSNNKDAFLQIEFKTRFVHPTHYSLKSKKGFQYATEWYLYGYNTMNEEPTLLSTDSSVDSTYCNKTTDKDTSCNNDNWGTFPIKHKANKGFRYLGIKNKKPSNPSYWRLTFSSFEVFGKLSIYQLKSKTRKKVSVYVLLRLFSTYLS